MIKKVIIANRGQIACRIIRTAKKMGIQTVAIYSDIDKNSKFVSMADTAYHVGGNPSTQSYLNEKKILEIAVDSKCDALHPGFGFLSENASFAQLCSSTGVQFIGPPPKAITAMGSKSESKKIMTAANVPVVPGYHQQNQDQKLLAEQAQKIGYPVLIKAVSGGGGKGMRIVHKPQDFAESLQSCRRQSLKAFKDDRVLVQKYITRPRHIQIQVFGDKIGNYVHLYERDCSIQRRHQKVVQQAPSNISDVLRQMICQSAVNAAKAVGYYNAGTVQFIFDLESNKHYFMEMNTRLQVQHPISQMITGQDFVQWQFLVASGHPLPKKQSQIQKKGHAVEVRVYAEDPFNSFLPGSGTLKYFKEPKQSEGVRIETGVRQHDTISTFYDPMIAKLITYAPNREEALNRMNTALESYKVIGLNNNLRFLKRVIKDSIFRKGDYDTSFIEKNIKSLLKKADSVNDFDLIAAAIARIHFKSQNSGIPNELINFRNVKGGKSKLQIGINETCFEKPLKYKIQLEQTSKNGGMAYIGEKKLGYKWKNISNGVIEVEVNGRIQSRQYFFESDTAYVFDNAGDVIGYTFLNDKRTQSKKQGISDNKQIKSPMPGAVTKVFNKVGDKIKKGQPLIAIQAMKMELVIRAEFDCVVKAINVKQAQQVEAGRIMVELDQ